MDVFENAQSWVDKFENTSRLVSVHSVILKQHNAHVRMPNGVFARRETNGACYCEL